MFPTEFDGFWCHQHQHATSKQATTLLIVTKTHQHTPHTINKKCFNKKSGPSKGLKTIKNSLKQHQTHMNTLRHTRVWADIKDFFLSVQGV